jgi:hypothetical protein
MATPMTSAEKRAQAEQAVSAYGSQRDAAKSLGIAQSTLNDRLHNGGIDPAIQSGMAAVGTNMVPVLAWAKSTRPDADGMTYSFMLKPKGADSLSLADMVRQSIKDALGDSAPAYEPRPAPTGEYLLVIDLADVHFLKLCVLTETGYEYNRQVARHRVMEGTKALLRAAAPYGVGRILFVLGNDILHMDNPRSTTTSGTFQDSDGTIFQGFSDAFAAMRDAIEICADVAPVDLVHCMSNHDWQMGWALSQKLGAWFANHPNVRATDYNLSERHRKYYGYGSNAFQIHHADGAKEEKLYALFVTEARDLIGKCKNLYSLCHHLHHKIRKRRGVDVFVTEKDHTGLTAIMAGSAAPEGASLLIEYVRSPSPPDGWHDRNGYVNRQGVECFMYHPDDGQKARFTEWF